MPFEAFDKKFEEAAAHHHPVYDEQAWNKMKQLLDKHLPEKKEKKRRIFWIWFLLFFMIAGGGSLWMIRDHQSTNGRAETAGNNTGMKENLSEKNDNNIVSAKQETNNTDRSNTNTAPAGKVVTQQNSEAPVVINNTENVNAGYTKEDKIAAEKTTGNVSAKKLKERKATSVSVSSATTKHKTAIVATSSPKNKKVSWLRSADNIDYASTDIVSSKKNKNKTYRSSSSKNKRSAKNTASDLSLTVKEKAETDKINDISVNNVVNKDEKNEAEIKENDPVISNNENKISKQVADKSDSAGAVNKNIAEKAATKLSRKKKNFSNSFGLSISAGPDVSAVGLSQVGSTRIVYGAGLSYQFARKWNIRTGIYTTSKVYHAKPSDYDPPSYFWNYYPSLEKINANCRVYEIPVIISYIIDQQKKHSWFASAGLSSVIMKRETYDYISKTSTGYETRSYTINDQNKHWMAEARLSFGYQQHFGNSSFIIEPYINTPLKGVGYGKVKLSGAGILFSVSIKPFAKK